MEKRYDDFTFNLAVVTITLLQIDTFNYIREIIFCDFKDRAQNENIYNNRFTGDPFYSRIRLFSNQKTWGNRE